MRLVLTVRHSSPTGVPWTLAGDRRERRVRVGPGRASRAEVAPERREDGE